MLSSLPSLPPLNAHELYFRSLSSPQPPGPGIDGRNGQPVASHTSTTQFRAFSSRTASHSALRSDENAVATRKANIRRFGAGWLRPPGIGKTLQGMEDEQLEREEQEAAQLREAALAEAQQLAEAQAAAEMQRQRGQAADPLGAANQANEGEDQRDLDADIPEASSPVSASGLDETDALSPSADADWVDEADGGLPLAGNEGDGDYADDLDQRQLLEDGSAMFMEQDLDDDVPEAGSYQHTDTDVEDSSSGDDADTDVMDRARGDPWASQILPPTMAAARQSFGGGGLGGSIFGSSPVASAGTARRNNRDRARRSGDLGS